MIQAGTYSATLQYLKAVKAAGTKDSDAVAKKLKELPVDDAFAQGQGAGKRPHGARPLSVRGQEAVGVEEAVGLLQAARRGARRQGVSVRQGQRLPADEVKRRGRAAFAVRRPARSSLNRSATRSRPSDRARARRTPVPESQNPDRVSRPPSCSRPCRGCGRRSRPGRVRPRRCRRYRSQTATATAGRSAAIPACSYARGRPARNPGCPIWPAA